MTYIWFVLAVLFLFTFMSVAGSLATIANAWKHYMFMAFPPEEVENESGDTSVEVGK